MLKISQVDKVFNAGTVNEKIALQNINLHLAPRDFVTVIGSNGAGKSTLMNIISGGLIPDQGTVTIDGVDVTKLGEHQRAKYIGRVFQDPMAGTAPNMTIEENLAIAYARGQRRSLSLGVNNRKRKLFQEQLEILDQGLENRLKTKVGFLSGGQRQALSLLMATFTKPKILLLDEHTAALDPKRARLILELTKKVVDQHHLTTLMVTHNMEQALTLGNRLLMMHEGRIVLDIAQEQKQRMTVKDLLQAFEEARGGEAFAEDRYFLA
ncbi:ABC transporter ATP-binding protein [Effusibacillus lacus]|uniref:ABC transporter ATP-binding protein n=1 Tax=Effusibacillus lacus TaxID=1348429 RepID=A0A292YFJ9_9BACL|nr:ABC transporter ATP-binding protein [Effusibacillus lacus]TCS68566.1 putative ABC transport system ATP-binding protein [Effusibacillus lacus]GAX88847.1 ABC transporter ATP-binding protein [Effusibacillus lacus]